MVHPSLDPSAIFSEKYQELVNKLYKRKKNGSIIFCKRIEFKIKHIRTKRWKAASSWDVKDIIYKIRAAWNSFSRCLPAPQDSLKHDIKHRNLPRKTEIKSTRFYNNFGPSGQILKQITYVLLNLLSWTRINLKKHRANGGDLAALVCLNIWKAVLSLLKISHQAVRKYDALDICSSFFFRFLDEGKLLTLENRFPGSPICLSEVLPIIEWTDWVAATFN